MNSSKDFERNQEQIINQLQSTIEILLTEYNPTQNVQEYDKTNSTKNESDCNQSDSSQFICSPFCTDFVTVHKRNKKIKKELFIVEYKKKLTQSQEELIAELRQKNLKFTKDYLDIIVVAMEEKHYYLKSFLTSGGQSDIFQGYHQNEEGKTQDRVFKIIKSDSTDYQDQMSEYNLLKSISYPINIIQFYDLIYIESMSICIIIIELCEKSLEEELRQMQKNNVVFTQVHFAQILFDLIDGLIELRAHNIIHQDIKPQNILKTILGNYVYTDFGISGQLKGSEVEIKGYTLYFSPPEQLTQQWISNYKGDIYSLGKTFQRLIYFYRSCQKEENFDSPFLQELVQIIESRMIIQSSNDRIDCLDLIQSIYEIVLHQDLKSISAFYLEKINKIISSNKYDNKKDIPFVLKAKKIYSQLHLQIRLHLSNIILFKDQIDAVQIDFLLLSSKIPLQQMKNIPDCIQQISICLFDLGEIKNALKYQQEALDLYKKIFTENHQSLATSYNNLGELYAILGQTQTALEFQTKSLEMNKSLYKNAHPSIYICLSNIGKRFSEQGDYLKALQYQNQSLKMRQTLYQGNHQSIANCLNIIGGLHAKLNEPKTALKFQLDALLMYREVLEENHPEIAACLNNVGKRYDEIGENTIALNYLTQALTMSKLLYNHDHPMIATSLHNLGQLYAKIGQPQKGLQFQIEALKVKEGIYPPNHPKLSQTLHNIGQRYAELGKPQTGLSYQLKSLDIRKKFYQGNNLNTAQSLDSIGERYAELKDYQKALSFQKEGLEMRKALLKGNHVFIASSLENVGERYAQLDQKQVALTHQLQALKMYKKLYHDDNYHKACCMNSVGKRYDEVGDLENALKYQLLSLEMKRRIFQTNHPSIAQSLNNVGERYSRMGNIQQAVKYQLQSLQMYESIYDKNHPYVRTILQNIISKYILLKQFDQVNKYQKQLAESNFQKDKQQIPFSKSSSSDQKQQVDKQQNDQPQSLQELQKSW